MTVASLSQARARRARLHEREAQDYRALLSEAPASISGNRVVWCFLRTPEPFEVEEVSPDLLVIVSAMAEGLRLTVRREVWRRLSGEPVPSDRLKVSGLIYSREMECVGQVPLTSDAPRLGLKLQVSLEESTGHGRIVALGEGRE